MADLDDGFEQVAAYLNGIIESFDFTLRGRDKSLGLDLIGVIHNAIDDRNGNGVDPDGAEWEPNRGDYGERKRSDGIPVGIGYYREAAADDGGDASWTPGGEMLSLVQIQGRIDLAPESVASTYGTDDEIARKGSWYTRGTSGPGDGEVSGAQNQPPRPFYGFNDADADAVVEEAYAALEQIIGD